MELLLCFVLHLSLFVFGCEAQDGSNVDIPWYIWLIIALAFSVAVILIVASIAYIILNCRKLRPPVIMAASVHEDRRRLVGVNPWAGEGVDAPFSTELSTWYSDIDWELPRKKVKIQRQLGIGEFGPIYDAEVHLGVNIHSRALIKVFQQGTSQDLARFREDIEALMVFNHPRVGKLFGVVSHPPYWAVMELTVNGDLKTFLMNASTLMANNKPALSVPQLVAMATDIASGLLYLDSLGYVHKDVAARNCIVTQNLTVKITDFKIGRYLFRNEYAVQADGSLMPLRWMAPESLLGNVFNLSTDVWSFGILLWEVMSRGSFPYSDQSDPEVVSAVCHHQQRLLQPVDCPHTVHHLMLGCWKNDPQGRPTMTVLHKHLESSILTTRYPSPP